ncbi:MAG: chemotaxis protein CheW, partial [Gammaproteobacteria bacterium]|nr:chemotaxis protein CheW [Gammaproteobacteria bacterium]
AAPAPPLEAGTPAADTPFQVLLFRVAGLTLAVPLAELNGVLPWPECITPLPGHTPFFLGVTTHLGRHVKIIDTGYLMAPEQHRPLQRRLPRRAETGLRHVVLMGGGEWGMACETIAEVLTLAPGEVRWRATRAERPWVAGTVTEHLCALLDTRAFAAELKGGGVSSGRNSS